MKKINNQLRVALLVCMCSIAFIAWNTDGKMGVYKTAEDFISHKLTYEAACASMQESIHANRLLNSSAVKISVNGAKYTLSKKEIFGYRDCYGNDFRFYENSNYKILDTVGFYLYSYDALAPSEKQLVKSTSYYFSTDSGSTIVPLTVGNLKAAFPSYINFQYALDEYAGNNKSLAQYDNYAHCYKVKFLFFQSQSINKQ